MLRRSFTATVARNDLWSANKRGQSNLHVTEPYECAWAREAIFFVRALEVKGTRVRGDAWVEISPDGIHWVREGAKMELPQAKDAVTFVNVKHFGGYLRLCAKVSRGALKVVVALALKE